MGPRLAVLTSVLGLLLGLAIGLVQVRQTAARFDARLEEERRHFQAGLDRLDRSLSALNEVVTADRQLVGDEHGEIRARIQDLDLAIEELRIAAMPIVAEIPELPIAPQ